MKMISNIHKVGLGIRLGTSPGAYLPTPVENHRFFRDLATFQGGRASLFKLAIADGNNSSSVPFEGDVRRKGMFTPPSKHDPQPRLRNPHPQLQTAATGLQPTRSSVPFEGDARRKGMFTVLLLSLLLLTSLLPAQTCLPILQDAQRAYNRGQLKQALTILQKAEICDIDNQIIQQRQRLQGRIFAAIDRQRVEAVEAKAEAEVARQEAEQARLRSDSSLAVANKLIDQLYFYEGKFGLTLKNIGTEFNLKYRYGFINQNGDEVIPFQFEEATPFSVEDGFARVKKGGKDYLLDTLGTTYLLANSLADLTLKKEALDLHEAIPDSLPEDIGRFQGLRVLLAYSSYGKRKLKHLPASIGRLANLQIVDLSSNQLKQLPPEVGNLNSITKLDLRSNRLSQLPPEVGNLNSLTELDLSYNRLKQLPPEVGNLNSITELNLNSNQLNQLPPEIGNLNSLNELRLEGNVLSQLPQEIASLKNLSVLNLNNNKLSQLPSAVESLKNLTVLNLDNNKLSELPPKIASLKRLISLTLISNKLSQLPLEITSLTRLTYLNLYGNQLNQLPPEIGKLTSLIDLQLAGNNLRQLPPEIGNLKSLFVVNLGGNQLSKLPPEIGKLNSLNYLYLNDNQLSELPPEIARLKNLTSLILEDNKLSQLPSEIGNLTSLFELILNNNQLSKLPPEIGKLNSLNYLYLNDNQLSQIPNEICLIPKLRIRTWSGFFLENNPLKEIPPCLLEKETSEEISKWANISLSDSLYHVSFQTIEYISQHHADLIPAIRPDLLAKLEAYEAAGITHEDFPRIRKLLADE